MIKHYLKMAFRNLLKYKMHNLISMLGLAIGFTCFVLSMLWIDYETTYDDFHNGADRIYFAGCEDQYSSDRFSYYTSEFLAGYLKENYPQVEKACHIKYRIEGSKWKYKDTEYTLTPLYADSSFFSMFNIKVIDGDNRLCLAGDQIAITDLMAKRLFGNESAIGKKIVATDKEGERVITAVVESWKGHSQFPYDIIIPMQEFQKYWGNQPGHTLFRTYPDTDIPDLQQKLSDYEVEYNGIRYTGPTPFVLLKDLKGLHPRGNVNVKLNHVHLFACIGGLVILCGLCNYLTMLITRVRMRKRELALRKVNGASDRSSLLLLLTELILLLLFSIGLGGGVIELFLPSFKELSQINENASFFYKETLLYMFALLMGTVIIATILVHYVSKRTLNDSIKQKTNLHFSSWFYKGSILFQLIISLGLIFCTVVMVKQLNFLLRSDALGLQRHNIALFSYIHGPERVSLEDALKKMPEVTEIMSKYESPIPKNALVTYGFDNWDDKKEGAENVEVDQGVIGPDFIDFFGVTVLKGSVPNEQDEPWNIMINETAAKVLGWDDPLGKKIYMRYRTYTVKGVIRDIYSFAPTIPVNPTFYISIFDEEKQHASEGNIIFKYKEGTWDELSRKLQKEVRKIAPDSELRLLNVEEIYDKYMKSENALCKLLSYVSVVCIVIALFGIFSLTTLSCEQRRKEIAIRKVNGANISSILSLFFKEYLILLIIASVIALPIGYFIMKQWIENYIKQTSIDLWVYLSVFVGMGLVILLSIVWRVWKAASQNPAEVIKNE